MVLQVSPSHSGSYSAVLSFQLEEPARFAAGAGAGGWYGAAALAASTPWPLNTPGLGVAAIVGLPWFTDANRAWFLLAACEAPSVYLHWYILKSYQLQAKNEGKWKIFSHASALRRTKRTICSLVSCYT